MSKILPGQWNTTRDIIHVRWEYPWTLFTPSMYHYLDTYHCYVGLTIFHRIIPTFKLNVGMLCSTWNVYSIITSLSTIPLHVRATRTSYPICIRYYTRGALLWVVALGGSLYFRTLRENKYRVYISSYELQLMEHVLVTKLKLYIELHGINKLGWLWIDHVREVLKLTHHRVQ